MRNLKLFGTALFTLALASCGSEQSGTFSGEDGEGEYTIDTDSGEASMTISTDDGEATFRTGENVPLDLPAGFSLMDGLEVVSNTVVNTPDGAGTLITYTTDRDPAEIIDYYRKQAEDAGIEIEFNATMNGSSMIGGESEGGMSLLVTATPSEEEDGPKTTGQITLGGG